MYEWEGVMGEVGKGSCLVGLELDGVCCVEKSGGKTVKGEVKLKEVGEEQSGVGRGR